MGIVQATRVVIPCYNEAGRLRPDAFVEALEGQPGLGFVMVDDGSRDTTTAVLHGLKSRAPERIDVLALERRSGKAEAVRRGVLRAADLGAELAGYWDADLSTPLRFIAEFAALIEREQRTLVLGSRVQLLGRRIERRMLRHYLGRGFATLASLALGIPVYDTQCGAKLFRLTAGVRSAFAEPFSLNWSFDVELIARLLARERLVGDICVERDCAELPLGEWVDAPGSKLTAAQMPGVALELVQLVRTVRATRRAASARPSRSGRD